MSDEQTIYISPEDDLTTVRERLEQIPARRLTMVIPPQTQLRSHVAWKLLYARAREIGKEVVIVSSDPQVRSVAHAVKFKVARSLETSPSASKSRLASRPGRTSNSGAGKTRTSPPASPRDSSAKKTNDPRNARNQRGASGARHPRARTPGPAWYEDPPRRQQTDSEEVTTEGIARPHPFEVSETQYSQPYDFRIHTSPPIRPLSDQIEEPDLLLEDYTQAQGIRLAAREGQKRFSEGDIEPEVEHEEEELPSHKTTQQSHIADDPSTYIDVSQPPLRVEQGDGASLEDFNTNEPVIQDIEKVEDLPASAIEYRGDRDDIVPPPSAKPITHTDSDAKEQENLPLRTYGVRPRRSHSGYLPPTPPTPPAAPTPHMIEEDALPPIEERQMRRRSSATLQPRLSGVRSTGKISPDTEASPIPRTSTGPGHRTPTRPTTRPVQRRRRLGAMRTGTGTRQRATQSKISRTTLVGVAIGILLLFAVSLLVYYGPTASIGVGIAAQNYPQQVTLTANVGEQAQGIRAQQFSRTFTKSGKGTATGSQEMGTDYAEGNVIFTYNGPNPNGIIIPSGSILTTGGGNAIRFATTAEVLIPPSNQNKVSPPVTIQAVKPGKDGNVDAGKITTIPDDTLNKIARAQNPPIAVSDLKLSVANSASTTRGGAQPRPAVTDQDLTNVRENLHQQLQGEITAWQRQLSSAGVVGTPRTTDTLISAPKVGDVEMNGTFSAAIKVTATVLLVHTADLQKEAIKQLSNAIKNDKSHAGDTILTDIDPPVTIDQLKQINADANSITFNFNAIAKIGSRMITKENIQHQVVGKSIPDARTVVMNTPGVKTVDITVSPGFISWVAFRKERITIIIRPTAGVAAHQTGR